MANPKLAGGQRRESSFGLDKREWPSPRRTVATPRKLANVTRTPDNILYRHPSNTLHPQHASAKSLQGTRCDVTVYPKTGLIQMALSSFIGD